jgi:hypothetical protein
MEDIRDSLAESVRIEDEAEAKNQRVIDIETTFTGS